MAVEIEQGEVFAARRQGFVSIESLMINTHDALVAPVEFAEPVPSLHGWGTRRPDHSSPLFLPDRTASMHEGCAGAESLVLILRQFWGLSVDDSLA